MSCLNLMYQAFWLLYQLQLNYLFQKSISIAQVLENITLNSYKLTVPRGMVGGGALVDKFWEAKTRYNQYFTNYFSNRFHETQLLYQVVKELQNLCFTWYKKLSPGEQMRIIIELKPLLHNKKQGKMLQFLRYPNYINYVNYIKDLLGAQGLKLSLCLI